MRNKTKIVLILASVSAAALALFAGCSGEISADEFLAGKDATNQIVTYYANGGSFDNTSNTVKDIHYAADSYVIGDFDSVQNISIAYDGNVFSGWNYAQTGADGKPLTDEDGNVLVSDRAVDFTVKIKQNEHWYVCAMWTPDLRVEVKLVTDDKQDMSGANGSVYKYGDVIENKSFRQGSAVIELKYPPVTSPDYTFTQYFYDEECTQRVLGNIAMPEGEDPENPVIYAQYIKGNWTMVRETADVRSMLNGLSSGNYYLCNMSANKTIDCGNMGVVPLKAGEIGARVEGNGFTLTNITYTVSNTLQAGGIYSVFGQISENTVMRDLTFENITVNLTNARQDVSLYLLAASAADGAVIENVTFKNAQLNITSQTEIKNIPANGEEYDSQNWLFGGEGTDAGFLEKFNGITVESGKLTINGKEYTFPNV